MFQIGRQMQGGEPGLDYGDKESHHVSPQTAGLRAGRAQLRLRSKGRKERWGTDVTCGAKCWLSLKIRFPLLHNNSSVARPMRDHVTLCPNLPES